MSMRGIERDEFTAPSDEFGGDDAFSRIDRNSSFDGTFRSDRDLRIEGEAKGKVDCQGSLFVAEGATVTATVEADNVTVAGELRGEVRCRGRLQIMPSGRLFGKVSTRSLVVNEGAIYEGELEMASADEPIRVARAQVLPPVPISAASEVRTGESRGNNATTFIRRMGGPETPWSGDEAANAEQSDEGHADERKA